MNGLAPSDPRAEYQRRLASWRERITAFDRTDRLISNARLVAVAAALVLVAVTYARGGTLAGPAIAATVFLALVIAHFRLRARRRHAARAAGWYERGLDRLSGRWAGTGRDGARFLDDHPYARDLDLFGRGSLFELLNTARTEAGEATLAGWLRDGAGVDEVRARQAAVGELRPKLDFREDLALLMGETDVSRTGPLAAWATAAPAGLSRTAGVAFAVCGTVTAVLALLYFAEALHPRWLIAWLIVETPVALAWRRRVQQVRRSIATPENELALLAALLARIEVEPASSSRLVAIRAALDTGGVPPSQRIAQLRRLVSWLDSTRNQVIVLVAQALLLPDLLAVVIDRWHAAYGRAVADWLGYIGELEAIAAIGTYAYEHPGDPFPRLVAHGPVVDGDGLAHPLISEDLATRNDVRLSGDSARLIIVSGSNMSGKSTWLRTVGVNVVLALAGAPVRATRLTVSPIALGATLRVEDSLQAGHSRFYAEILRIGAIVEAARGATPMLFLLDEILHGTNSHDRRIGAEGIVRALLAAGAIGLVTTHDLALTELATRLDGAKNVHFEDRLENGRMVFDYRVRPGVVEHSNALALMRAIGLEV